MSTNCYVNRKRLSLSLLFIALFSLQAFSQDAASVQDGEALFKANCASCHAVKEKLVGPALKGIETRRPEEWLLKWIKNSGSVVKSGDEYAVKLYNEYNKVAMPSFNLKDAEIKSILAYVKDEAAKPDAVPVAGTPAAGAPAEEEAPIGLYLLIAIAVLYGLSMILGRVQHTLERTVRQRDGLPEPVQRSRKEAAKHWARNNKKLVAVMLLVFVGWGSVKGWYTLKNIGVMQGYTPDQPINFSHKLHAGEMQIQCIYCHSGAEKGKVAGVPSANVCMNCHKYVRKGPVTGTEEIAKIYKALDYDADKGTYGTNPKPLQWVRVHNLPDLAYFNHAQHVAVGKIACQTCHGPVQDSMTVVGQYSPLTMGWCIDCHRKTEVKMAGNNYYNDYHKQLLSKPGADSIITVSEIGGLECARCHY
ncbi:MAG: c-type cytochrome [Bacteroidota bacterium]